jgi:hypothetical protein
VVEGRFIKAKAEYLKVRGIRYNRSFLYHVFEFRDSLLGAQAGSVIK